jgi:thioredoxin-like negative regulator of GroEL
MGPPHEIPETEERRDERPLLLFFSSARSGPARRMASLVAWFGVTEKKRLRVQQVDVDTHAALARALNVTEVPTLVLLRADSVLDRREGRTTGPEITRMLSEHLPSRGTPREEGGPSRDRAGRAA